MPCLVNLHTAISMYMYVHLFNVDLHVALPSWHPSTFSEKVFCTCTYVRYIHTVFALYLHCTFLDNVYNTCTYMYVMYMYIHCTVFVHIQVMYMYVR